MNIVLRSFLAACAIVLLPLAHNALAEQGILRMSDGQNVSFSQMITDAAQADQIFIGEVHDQKTHHDLEFAMIRALHERKIPLAIGLEMIQMDSQQMLDDWSAGKMSEQSFMKIYSRNWSYSWPIYREIFIFARDNQIPLVGLNVPKQIVSKVGKQGFASLSPEEKKNLPDNITCDLSLPYTELMNKFFSPLFKHVTKERNFDFYCQAQALRNNGMALNIDRYLQKNPGRKMVTIAGLWHAVKSGIPAQLKQSGKQTSRVILPEVAELGPRNATSMETDYLILK